ncbi:hypothetical protein D3C81_1900250 [compost metagenome]
MLIYSIYWCIKRFSYFEKVFVLVSIPSQNFELKVMILAFVLKTNAGISKTPCLTILIECDKAIKSPFSPSKIGFAIQVKKANSAFENSI